MRLERIRYRELTSKQQEIYNFQKVAWLLADYGFNCIKLDDDWQGADFLAYHKDGSTTLKVQLKGRATDLQEVPGQEFVSRFSGGRLLVSGPARRAGQDRGRDNPVA